uniref:Uncharacterized protein n=1 Tax=Oryza sativa subsp. japonica TaxID=39947 RepID=Q7XHV2_ORYSJ|nr:hypothetical protein [Oryza sativa Japonica Group]BAD30707.1 hypothetical protein [Oryza sativa Japonica Group]
MRPYNLALPPHLGRRRGARGASGCHITPLGPSGYLAPWPTPDRHVAGGGNDKGVSPVSGGRRRWAPLEDGRLLSFRAKARMVVRSKRHGSPSREGVGRGGACGIPLN